MLSYADLLALKRWNTPTIYNAWEACTTKDRLEVRSNRDETHDFMPQMGSMIGYAVTLTFEPSRKEHFKDSQATWNKYREYVASIPGPKIVVLQDLDSPDHIIGSFWGEVCSNMHKALGCVGTITDGAIRDLDEMTNAGFKAIIHMGACSDKHGFIVIPPEDQEHIVEAASYMDRNECDTTIGAARQCAGKSMDEVIAALKKANEEFAANTKAFRKKIGLEN